jgi:hypothetical protein
MNHNHHSRIVKYSVPRTVVIILAVLLLFPMVAYAEGPVVCLADHVNVRSTNYNLSACNAPIGGEPVLVRLVGWGATSAITGTIQLVEGVQRCRLELAPARYAECLVTVRDGTLDAYAAGSVQSWSLLAEWQPGIFTKTLSSGDTLTIERLFSYGEIVVGVLLFFLLLLAVFAIMVYGVKRPSASHPTEAILIAEHADSEIGEG